MGNVQVKNGKAFEYACLESLYESLSPAQYVSIEDTPQLVTARDAFMTASDELRVKLRSAANAATRMITRLEPQLEYPDRNTPLFLSIQADSQGQLGDVRDVLCIRKQNQWEIGLSCKHNHRAVKHSRLSATIDFGADWFDIPCSSTYFDAVTPLFEELRTVRESSGGTAKWSDYTDKVERFYVPVLNAFMDELKRIDVANPHMIPERLIRYLVGRNDFYKVITNNAKKTTLVEAINITGTLNRSSKGVRSVVNIARLRLPRRFHNIDFKINSGTTIEVVCDEGWTVSMRLHNASTWIEPSLKFDVNLISLPNTIHAQVEPW
ncbi:MAG: HaeIII family restriction endonuclease [Lachnospiraceae bacterium]|jgi:hypothetical protein|nr:HaeIII family restriction endonuclease [Lachnospiraceae bacterium]